MIGIYKITSPNNRIYIGQSIDIEKRWKHYQTTNIWVKQQKKLFASLRKYGAINHLYEIVEECSVEQLNEREIYWIKYFNSVKEGLNVSEGGNRFQQVNKGKKHKLATINKMKQWWNMNKKSRPQEVIDKIKQTKRNNPRITTKEMVLKYRETAPNKKIVEQYSLDGIKLAEFNSINEAARQTNSSKDGISFCCNGKQNTSNGFIWKFKLNILC
jgi:group I intron endonuclease